MSSDALRRSRLRTVKPFVPMAALALASFCLPSGRAIGQCALDPLPKASAGPGDQFGRSLATDGSRIVVGSRYSATVFLHEPGASALDVTDDTWIIEQEIFGQATGDDFGCAVAIDGDRLLVGAALQGGGFLGPGAVYAYRRSPAGWIPESVLKGLWAGGNVPHFGCAVAMHGDIAVVGADWGHFDPLQAPHGIVYSYRRDDHGSPLDPTDDTWVEQEHFAPADIEALDDFGRAVALGAGQLLVGAPGSGTAGAVHDFRLDDGSTPGDSSDDHWVERAKLAPPSGTPATNFGHKLSLDGDRLLVGAQGAAFEFRLDNSGTASDPADDAWIPAATLLAPDTEPDDLFGSAVSLRDELAVVGAVHAGSGASYLFRRTPAEAGWEQIARLKGMPAGTHSFFGVSSVLTADHLLLGSMGWFPGLGGSSFFGKVQPYALANAPWSFLSATSGGAPSAACLLGNGDPEPAAPIAVVLQGQPPLAQGFLFVGASSIDQPFKGGVLIPSPDRIVELAASQGEKLLWESVWPPGIPQGATFFVQGWFTGSGSGPGISCSNGLAVTAH